VFGSTAVAASCCHSKWLMLPSCRLIVLVRSGKLQHCSIAAPDTPASVVSAQAAAQQSPRRAAAVCKCLMAPVVRGASYISVILT
jgi:hypothetical protein